LNKMIKVDLVEMKENFPLDGEAYAILTDGSKFAFAWGPEFPFSDEVPATDLLEGEAGLQWFDSEDAARSEMLSVMEIRSGK
jgi:hypothetical protein